MLKKTKYTRNYVKKEIPKYWQLYNISPKKINLKVFKNIVIPPLNSILSQKNIILTSPKDVASNIYIQQSIINKPIVLHAPINLMITMIAHVEYNNTHSTILKALQKTKEEIQIHHYIHSLITKSITFVQKTYSMEKPLVQTKYLIPY